MAPPFIRRVQIENFRSIARCDVELGPLMFIVGRNGSGKSNFLDALRFISEALNSSLDKALDARGGHSEVRRRSAQGRPYDFRISFDAQLDQERTAEYAVTIGPSGENYRVKEETCSIRAHVGADADEFRVNDGIVSGFPNPPLLSPGGLFLEVASGIKPFGLLYQKLRAMKFFNLVPDRMRELVPIGGRTLMTSDGRNVAALIDHLQHKARQRKLRIDEYLGQILPGLKAVEYKPLAGYATVGFRQNSWQFNARQMSDGTLRALGILAAVLSPEETSLVGIEEPEIALHPAAFGILRDALREGAEASQILVTSQSPELLDDSDLKPEQILGVAWDQGETRIGPITAGEASLLRKGLMTAGELLHQRRLEPAAQS